MKFEKILPYMREFPQLMDAVKLMDLCWTIPLRREQIAQVEAQVSHPCFCSTITHLIVI